jgi:glycosyltransferase involved in cell wall biosynthesis
MPNQFFQNPHVSICIPTYNGREHLKECIDSIRAQTFGNFEVVICDDQSSDGTLDFARELAQGDERFRFIQNPRRFGLVGNWNNCVAVSRGEWIKFVFQDDLLLPLCLERMTTVTGKSNALFVACRRGFQFEPGTTDAAREVYAANADKIEEFFSKSDTVAPGAFGEKIREEVGNNFVGEPTATLIHRQLFMQNGGFNENLINTCDLEYWCRIGTQVGVTFIPEMLVMFRVHGSSTSADNFKSRNFRMNFLDPFIMVYEFNCNPSYTSLRKITRARWGANYFARLCRQLARQAWSTLRQKELAGNDDAPRCRQEWETVCQAYPRLRRLARPPGVFERARSTGRRCLPEGIKRRVKRLLRA